MAIAASRFALDLSALPSRSDELRVGFGMGMGNNKKPLLLVYPGVSAAFEPQHIRYAADMTLKLDDGTVAQKLGQFVVTGERIIGMITSGIAGGTKLNASSGSVYAFVLGLDDIQPVEVKTSRKGTPAEALIQSRDGQRPVFSLHIGSVVGSLSDAGVLTYSSSLSDLLNSLTPESRAGLRRPPTMY